MRQKLIFWGGTGQSKVLKECLSESDYDLLALFDNNPKVISPFKNIPLYYGQEGFESWIKNQSVGDIRCLVAIGGSLGTERYQIQCYLKSFGVAPITAIHRTAFVAANAVVGEGTQILAQSAVCTDVRLGDACILNTSSSVDHDCRIGKGVHIAAGAHLAGEIEVEDFATIFSGAVVLPRIRIGTKAIVGAGAVVTKDVPAFSTVVGNPARVIQSSRI